MNKEKLAQPLDPKHIKKRKQGGASLSYIEGYHAINTANEVFGYGRWSKQITMLSKVAETQDQKNGRDRYTVAYIATVSIQVNSHETWSVETGEVVKDAALFEDVGYGNGISYSSFADAHELATKEAVTDAMKRCLRHFGDQFGNCLYNKDFVPQKPQVAPESNKAADPAPDTPEPDEDTLPAMKGPEKKRMARIWKYVNDNMNPDGVIKPGDVAKATYITLGGWPQSAADEEQVINTIGVEKPK